MILINIITTSVYYENTQPFPYLKVPSIFHAGEVFVRMENQDKNISEPDTCYSIEIKKLHGKTHCVNEKKIMDILD